MIIFNGILIGLAIAAPVGPIGVLVIKKTWNEGWRSGFFSGLGAATADGLYGAVAAFGLTFVSNFLVSEKFWLRLIGGLFLIYLGVKTFLTRPKENLAADGKIGHAGNYLSTVFLTITNPMTILSFAAIFTGLGLVGSNSFTSASLIVLGVFLGSALWWLILSASMNLLRAQLKIVSLDAINKVSGVVIVVFGIVAILSIF